MHTSIATILERRKNTARYLKQAIDQVSCLEELQVDELKQQIKQGRYIGISEPGIIASESPNAIVNELVIMPDIEKRLESFVRLSHAIIVNY